jgi:hypothetical protein
MIALRNSNKPGLRRETANLDLSRCPSSCQTILKQKDCLKNVKKKRNAYLDHSYLSVASEPTINNSDRKPLLTRPVPTSDCSGILTDEGGDASRPRCKLMVVGDLPLNTDEFLVLCQKNKQTCPSPEKMPVLNF